MRTHLKLGLLLAVVALAALAALTACGGEEEPAATTPAGETPTQAPTAEPPTSTPERGTPAAAASPTAGIDWCDLVTPKEVDEALGEPVTGTPSVPNRLCQWQTDSGIYLRIEPGAPEDLQASAKMEGVEGEPVLGVGEGAAWFGGVQAPSHHLDFEEVVTLGVLSVHQGDAYFRIVLNLPKVDSSTQLEIAKGLAAKAIERLP